MAANALLVRTKQRLRRAHAFTVLLGRTNRGLLLGLALLTLVRALLPAALMLATGALVAAAPEAIAAGVDSAAARHAGWALAGIGAALLVSSICTAAGSYLQQVIGSLFVHAVHDTVAGAAVAPAGIAPLEDPEVVGELSAVDEYDDEGVYSEAVSSLEQVVMTRIQGVAAFVILLGYHWWAPLVLLVAWRLSDRTVQAMDDASMTVHHQRGTSLRRGSYLRSLAVEAPTAKEIRVFGFGAWAVAEYSAAWFTGMAEVWRQRRVGRRTRFLAGIVLVAAYAFVLATLADAAWTGALSVAAFVVFAQAALATESLGAIDYQRWVLSQAQSGAQHVLALERRLGGSPEPARARARASGAAAPVEVRWQEVRFSYPGQSKPTLDGLTLTIPPGQSLAIVGANGAGKSTLVKLACGLYEPQAGQVIVDGGSDLRAARSRIAVIFQDFVRYELSLRANVGFGSLPLAGDLDSVASALRDAGADDLLASLPAGWDTVLARDYPDGADLSGGQWQKVALARALLAVRGGAGLLVLDEPTAHLDVRAENELFERFLALTKDVTTILVSHRLSGVRRADRIVVVADGRIAEDGTHEELLASGGEYAAMYALQAERFTATKEEVGPSA